MTSSVILAALLMAGTQNAETQSTQAPEATISQASTLSSDSLSQGKTQAAIAALEKQLEGAPNDPALLINLGIAHAQAGDEAAARTMFNRALSSPDPIELETADGSATDSRRLARKALKMLERGEFAPTLSRRD